MKQRSRKISSFLLLMCFIAPLGFTFTILKVKQWQVREQIEREILQGMDKGELVQFTFSKAEAEALDWEHEREFMYNGQSYDVVEQEEVGDSVTYYVWWDKVETKIKNQLAELVAMAMNQDADQQQNQNQLEKLLKSLHYNGGAPEEQPFISVENNLFNEYINSYTSLRWAPPVPPPLFV